MYVSLLLTNLPHLEKCFFNSATFTFTIIYHHHCNMLGTFTFSYVCLIMSHQKNKNLRSRNNSSDSEALIAIHDGNVQRTLCNTAPKLPDFSTNFPGNTFPNSPRNSNSWQFGLTATTASAHSQIGCVFVDFHFRGFTSGSVKTMESRFR